MQRHSNKAPSLAEYLYHVYHFRAFTIAMVQRALRARYAQTVLGSLWIIMQPLFNLFIFILLFDKLMGIYKGNIPYALFAFSGLIAWNLFSYISLQGGIAVVQNRDLLKRLYFPKITLVLTQILIGLIDFAIGLFIIILAIVVLNYGFTLKLLLLPVFILANVWVSMAIAVFMNIISVKKRDYYQVLPYLINFGMWVTPVFYPVSIIPLNYRFLLYCNPMAGVIEGYRFCLFNDGVIDFGYLPVSLLFLVFAMAGIYQFKESEHTFIDTL